MLQPTAAGPRTLRRPALRGLVRGVLVLTVLAGSGCGGEPAALTVGPVGFTAEELGALGPSQQRVLADLTGLGLAVAEGRVDTLIEPYVDRDARSIVLQQLAMELSADSAGIDEAELRRRYRADPRHELDVRHLVILSERWRPAAHRDSARAVAEEALAEIRSGAAFAGVAAEYSDEPGAAERGGLLQPGREGSWVPEFWEAASSLEEGEVSDVVETEFGFHVLKLVNRRPVPFEEVRDDVLRSATDLPSALGSAESWAERRMRLARVDTAAITAWAADRGRTPAAADQGPRVLVSWPDSLGIRPLTTARLERLRTTAPEPAAGGDAAGAVPPRRRVERVVGEAQTYMMMEAARSAGIEASAAQRAAIRQSWTDRVTGWATALGFRTGQQREMVKAAALQALGAPEQSAAIARSEVERIRPRLRSLYPVSVQER